MIRRKYCMLMTFRKTGWLIRSSGPHRWWFRRATVKAWRPLRIVGVLGKVDDEVSSVGVDGKVLDGV